jgi:aspartate aminotransferase-like enzyme
VDNFDIIIAISALELALKNFGANIDFGKGVAAAQEILLEAY